MIDLLLYITSCYDHHPDLHPFPTRRSSDLLLGSALGILLLIVIALAAATQTALSVRSRWTEIGVLRAVGYGRRCTVLAFAVERSEEHTSELQSRPHLVCRLLLEKKKHNAT